MPAAIAQSFPFDERNDAAQTIDNKNIIIQGDRKMNKDSWSVIGGLLTNSDGVIELTVTWSEL
ncbi:hypothetical protein [Paenibacillus sp. J2TS4]|uniref:hypothetical protein n=1 Tax=Paenibacillus sp. J2TS4 TaxID=2807194 RepID=UPI001B19670C|nr:hypothetical protein [Paenibacillus sp. J2TS4]GIP34871.1 hypothetical protein J2TS4_40810 [Paenibacillus sp. J2TS4]